MKHKTLRFLTAGALCLSLFFGSPGLITSLAAPRYMPGVTAEMSDPAFWSKNVEDPNALLADPYKIAELNASFLAALDCKMNDLKHYDDFFDGDAFKQRMTESAAKEMEKFANGKYFDMAGNTVTAEFLAPVLENLAGLHVSSKQYVSYGICTNRSDIRSYPTIQIVTDALGDIDYDEFQLGELRVGEPVIIKAMSADRLYYYVVSDCVSGWTFVGDIAVCKDKNEWLAASEIPADRALVVAEGKFRLERSNTNPDISERLLTLGTVLKQATDAEAEITITNRRAFNNYAAWLPMRDENGKYYKKLVLIPENRGVHEGYLPLTTNNILNTAFSMLGDAYGWGAMLGSVDCSAYIRDIYHCFGLNLPRNTTWQSAMPVAKLTFEKEAPVTLKKEVLNTLPPGAVLFFSGHEMMYLGHVGDNYYVISSVSSIKDAESGTKMRLRGIVISTLETNRMSGHTWLEDIHTALLPYVN